MVLTPHFLQATLATEATEGALDIDAIKSALDGFDPAALLPDLSKVFGSIETLCRWAVLVGPVILLVLGLAYLFFAPREANYYFGYRCYYGMGSVPAWRFTQRLAGLVLGTLGLVLTIVMAVIGGGFGSLETINLVWRTVACLAWEAGLSLAATIAINLTAALRFNGKGELRKEKK